MRKPSRIPASAIPPPPTDCGLRAACPRDTNVHLIGAAPLCALYARAITEAGATPILEDSDAAAAGLARIGRNAPWN